MKVLRTIRSAASAAQSLVSSLRAAGLVLALACLAAAGIASASPASADSSGNWFQNEGNGLCLQPVGGSSSQGAAIVQEPCDKYSMVQRWVAYYPSGNIIFQARNVATGLCLDARGGATNGTSVQQWACNTISNEKWDLGPNYVVVRSRVSGTQSHCLDVPGGSGQAGLAMQLWGCNNTLAQVWQRGGPDPIIL